MLLLAAFLASDARAAVTLTTLHSFTGPEGANPFGLLQGSDGNFYGTALFGGEYEQGTLFSVSPEGSVNVLFSFDGTNGFDPNTLFRASDGNFYGTTAWGGPRFAAGGAGYGTFFKLTPDGSYTFLYWFHNTNGSWPTALIEASDGNFYGTTAIGGPISSGFSGTIFKITRDGEHTMLVSFSGTNGFEPRSLMRATDGNFYGMTRGGTANAKHGTIFKATADGILTTLFSFNGTNGASPGYAPLVQTADDSFYGITYSGGASNLGTVFRFQITPEPPMLKWISQIGGGLTFTWAALTGRSYQVQFNTNLTQTNWVALGDPVNGTNSTASANDVISPDHQRFYRVVLLP